MALVRIGRNLVYFAHVPKCAGTAVERYLIQRFGRTALAFLDGAHYKRPAARRWSQSSPQHIDRASLARLFPPGYFDASFAVVRHPAERLRSVFLYQRDLEGRIARDRSFSDWLAALPDSWALDPWYLDNHTRPMVEMIPDDTRIFRLEAGLAPLVGWLDQLAGDRNGPREIGIRHTYRERLAATDSEPGPEVRLGDADLSRIASLYAEDFARFGYDLPEVAATSAPGGVDQPPSR